MKFGFFFAGTILYSPEFSESKNPGGKRWLFPAEEFIVGKISHPQTRPGIGEDPFSHMILKMGCQRKFAEFRFQ